MTLRPPGGFIGPTNPGVHADTRRRVLAQEQVPIPAPPEPRFCLTACSAGPLTVDVESNPWSPWWAVDLERVVVKTIGVSSDWAATLLRDGDAVLEVTGSVAGTSHTLAALSWGPLQELKVAFTGTVNVATVQMWFRGVGGGGLIFAVPAGGGG